MAEISRLNESEACQEIIKIKTEEKDFLQEIILKLEKMNNSNDKKNSCKVNLEENFIKLNDIDDELKVYKSEISALISEFEHRINEIDNLQFKNILTKSSKTKSSLIKEIDEFCELYKKNRTLDRKAIENIMNLKESQIEKCEKLFSFMLSNEINYLSEIQFQEIDSYLYKIEKFMKERNNKIDKISENLENNSIIINDIIRTKNINLNKLINNITKSIKDIGTKQAGIQKHYDSISKNLQNMSTAILDIQKILDNLHLFMKDKRWRNRNQNIAL